jgi:antitoxin ParD1/3/4
MNVQLRPDLERFIEEQVKAGHFTSPSQVVEAGIARLMLDTDPANGACEDFAPGEMDQILAIANEQIDRGEVLDGETVFDDIRQSLAEMARGDVIDAHEVHGRLRSQRRPR